MFYIVIKDEEQMTSEVKDQLERPFGMHYICSGEYLDYLTSYESSQDWQKLTPKNMTHLYQLLSSEGDCAHVSMAKMLETHDFHDWYQQLSAENRQCAHFPRDTAEDAVQRRYDTAPLVGGIIRLIRLGRHWYQQRSAENRHCDHCPHDTAEGAAQWLCDTFPLIGEVIRLRLHHIFEFNYHFGTIYIRKCHGDPQSTHIQIPDFVYGFVFELGGSDVTDDDDLELCTNTKPYMLGDYTYFGEHDGPFSAPNYPITSISLGKGLRSLKGMFFATTLRKLDLSHWNVSQIEDMGYLFSWSELNDVGDLSGWDISKVVNMEGLFFASDLSDVGDLGGWNVSQVIHMERMFDGELTNVGDLSHWDVSRVEHMREMFNGSLPRPSWYQGSKY